MYLWLKRIFYGCDHDYQFIHKFYTHSDGYIIKTTILHRCTKCKKLKKDVINS